MSRNGIPEEPESTPPVGPFPRQIAEIREAYAELRAAIDSSERRIMAVMSEVGHGVATVKLVQGAWESRVLELEKWRRDTEPCAPPEAE